MENQNEIVLKINRDEIFFSCKGYSEEFINTISDIINQKRRSLTVATPGPAEETRRVEIENKKTETSEESINGSHKEKAVIKVCIFNPDAIKFLKDIMTKNGRAFFVKNVILLYFYNRKAYENPEMFIGKNPISQNNVPVPMQDIQIDEEPDNSTAMPDMSRVLRDF